MISTVGLCRFSTGVGSNRLNNVFELHRDLVGRFESLESVNHNGHLT